MERKFWKEEENKLVFGNVEFLISAFHRTKKEVSGKAVAKWLVWKANCGKANAEAKRRKDARSKEGCPQGFKRASIGCEEIPQA